MKKRITDGSIVWQLLASTIGIFITMLLGSNYLLSRKQSQMTTAFAQQIAKGLVGFPKKNTSTLILDATQTQTLNEYRVYACLVLGLTILIGSILLALVIVRILRPFKQMTHTINQIDINNIQELQKDIGEARGSKEIRDLAKSFQQALRKIYENYEKQRQFGINVAHELRTPLAIVLTKVDVFKKQYTQGDPTVLQFVDTLQNNIERLSKLVEDMLFLTREHTLKQEDVSIRDLCEEVILDLEDKADQKAIALSVTGQAIRMPVDDVLLERAVYNLVDNAIKYTQEKGMCKIAIESDADAVYINVIDDGPGIPDARKQAVFDLFYRMDDSRNRTMGGYGIGLSLVRDIVSRMKGSVRVLDHVPRGSIFQIILPYTGNRKKGERS